MYLNANRVYDIDIIESNKFQNFNIVKNWVEKIQCKINKNKGIFRKVYNLLEIYFYIKELQLNFF